MNPPFESLTINLEQLSLTKWLATQTTTDWFQFLWQDTESMRAPTQVELAQAEASLMTDYRVVVFGDVSWPLLFQLQQRLTDSGLVILGSRVNKPTACLAGAVDFALDRPMSSELRKGLLEWSQEVGIELCVLVHSPRIDVPGLLVMDMDSTAIEIECIDEIAKLAGVGEAVSKVTAAAMRGELDFAESLKARVKTLTDAPVSIIDEVANNLPLMPGIENLVATLKQHNWKLVIASGGFTYMTDVLKRQLNLDATVANQLEMQGGMLTGRVLGDIVDAHTKAETVHRLAAEYGIEAEQTVAMGDGANDLLMMDAANLGVAFHAKPLVHEKADVGVRAGGLDQLLYLL